MRWNSADWVVLIIISAIAMATGAVLTTLVIEHHPVCSLVWAIGIGVAGLVVMLVSIHQFSFEGSRWVTWDYDLPKEITHQNLISVEENGVVLTVVRHAEGKPVLVASKEALPEVFEMSKDGHAVPKGHPSPTRNARASMDR